MKVELKKQKGFYNILINGKVVGSIIESPYDPKYVTFNLCPNYYSEDFEILEVETRLNDYTLIHIRERSDKK